jgi:hypothetical protein
MARKTVPCVMLAASVQASTVDFTQTGIGLCRVDDRVLRATTQSMGLPDNPNTGGVWIMNAGTSTAHLMVPGH